MENPYDELPYRTYPVEWSTPERLGLTSLLHGGPRVPTEGYRVLELGCGDGGNLLPMAWYRRHASFVGIDGAGSQIEQATAHAEQLGLGNLRFLHADFLEAAAMLEGHFDFILAHGVFSWIPDAARDALLRLCAEHLSPGGLLYFNYNTQPGWAVRGLVRDFLLAQTQNITGLHARAEAARHACQVLTEGMADDMEHPYRQLMHNEFEFVNNSHVSYIAHEFLSEYNRPYWRRELLAIMSEHGFSYVADADFNYPWGREDPNFGRWLEEHQLVGGGLDDTIDLLRYRQLHSPIFTRGPVEFREVTADEMSELYLASELDHQAESTFVHPNGIEIEVSDERLRNTFDALRKVWPVGHKVREVCAPEPDFYDDLKLLNGNQLVQLRLVEPAPDPGPDNPLSQLELQYGGFRTTPAHRRIDADKE